MIVGFGKTETDFENALEDKLADMVASMYKTERYFSDEFVKKIRSAADAMADKSQKEADSYKDAETFPSRYSRFWISTVADASHIIFVVSFHHINRRHAFSPDGWACLTNKKAFVVESIDLDSAKRKAS